jgi:hypothetical protein
MYVHRSLEMVTVSTYHLSTVQMVLFVDFLQMLRSIEYDDDLESTTFKVWIQPTPVRDDDGKIPHDFVDSDLGLDFGEEVEEEQDGEDADDDPHQDGQDQYLDGDGEGLDAIPVEDDEVDDVGEADGSVPRKSASRSRATRQPRSEPVDELEERSPDDEDEGENYDDVKQEEHSGRAAPAGKNAVAAPETVRRSARQRKPAPVATVVSLRDTSSYGRLHPVHTRDAHSPALMHSKFAANLRAKRAEQKEENDREKARDQEKTPRVRVLPGLQRPKYNTTKISKLCTQMLKDPTISENVKQRAQQMAVRVR